MNNLAEKLSDINIDILPPQLRLLIDIIGLCESFRLLEKRGGTPLFICENPEKANVFKNIISDEAIIKLCTRLGPSTIELPKPDKITKQLRNMAIRADSKTMNNVQLARKYNKTRKYIINILKQDKEDDPTPDLFD